MRCRKVGKAKEKASKNSMRRCFQNTGNLSVCTGSTAHCHHEEPDCCNHEVEVFFGVILALRASSQITHAYSRLSGAALLQHFVWHDIMQAT